MLHKIEPYPVHFCITNGTAEQKALETILSVPHSPIIGDIAAKTCTYDSPITFIIAIHLPDDFKKSQRIEQICTITHEVAHAVLFLWEYINESNPGQEANAYLAEHLMRICYEKLYPKKVKNVVSKETSDSASSSVDR